MEEAHSVDDQILFGEFEAQSALAFFLALTGDESQRKFSLLRAFLSGVVKGEEVAVAGQDHSVLQVITNLSNTQYFDGFVALQDLIKRDHESNVDALLGGLIFTDHCKSVVVPVPTHTVHLFLDLHTYDFQRLFTSQ